MAKPYIACLEERPLDGLFDLNYALSALEDVTQHISRRIAPRLLPLTVRTEGSQQQRQLHCSWQHQQQQEDRRLGQQPVVHRQQNEQEDQRTLYDQQQNFSNRPKNTEGASSTDATTGSACDLSQQQQQQSLSSSGEWNNSVYNSLPVHSSVEPNAYSATSATENILEYTCPTQGPKRRSRVPAAWQGFSEKDRDSNKVWGEMRHRFFTYKPESCDSPEFAADAHSSCNARAESSEAVDQPPDSISATRGGRRDSEIAREEGRLRNCGVATQSVYREQETQTTPYSAPVVVPASQHPEEIMISHLCWQNGLPATQDEIAIIRKMRQKRKIEQLLPPATDEYSFLLRTALMEDQEFREWADREKQLKDLQDRRLELFREAIKARAASALRREEQVLSRTESRLKEQEFLFALKKEKRRIKVMRNIWREKVQLEEYLNPIRWKAIANSCSRSSPLYAPKSMKGYVADDLLSSLNLDRLALKNYRQLAELANAADKTQQHRGCFSVKKTSYRQKAEARLKQALDSMSLRLRQESVREQGSKDRGTTSGFDVPAALIDAAAASPLQSRESHASALKKTYMKNIRERPETPRVEEVLPEDEELQVAVVLLQRVLRGQACQQRMFEGKEKRLDLINFLRASEQLSDIPVEEQEALVDKEAKQELSTVLTASFQGYAIAEALDELSKELRKVQEERRIAAMVALAERDRRLREAQESGTRQAEELLRQREDESFRRITALHQQTVDSYVESILTSTVDHVAQQRALEQAREEAKCLSLVVDAVDEKYKDPLQVSRELMMCFLLPHVKKQQLQRQLRQEEEKFVLAAHYGVGEGFRALRPEHGPLF